MFMASSSYDYCIGTASPSLKRSLATMLNKAGFITVGEGKSVSSLLRTLHTVQPWLVVVDTALPPGNIGELAGVIAGDALAAALYIDTGGPDLGNYVKLPWPVEEAVLVAVAEAVCSEFVQIKRLQGKIETLQKKLKERKVLERAKGLLARHYCLEEDQAYRLLRRFSMEQSMPIAEAAEQIIADPARFSGRQQRR